MATITIDISIPAEEYLRHYTGSARQVVARARDGRQVRFPAGILRPFVTRSGIHGSFQINFSAEGRFRTIARLD